MSNTDVSIILEEFEFPGDQPIEVFDRFTRIEPAAKCTVSILVEFPADTVQGMIDKLNHLIETFGAGGYVREHSDFAVTINGRTCRFTPDGNVIVDELAAAENAGPYIEGGVAP